jgi:hypothetical protein
MAEARIAERSRQWLKGGARKGLGPGLVNGATALKDIRPVHPEHAL